MNYWIYILENVKDGYLWLASVNALTTSRHTILRCVAQEAGVPHRGYIDRKKENVIFTPLYLGDNLSD